MENNILPYIDGRLKPAEMAEVEKHFESCAACKLRVNEFRAVSGLLDELPMIEPSPAFDVRVRARVAAEPVKQSWWSWWAPAPRVAFAAALLMLATIWTGWRPGTPVTPPAGLTGQEADLQMINDLPVLEDDDVVSSFDALKDLPQPVQAEDGDQEM